MARKRADAAVKERLTRDRIVDCAIALAESEGLEAVTIRRLAHDQGVTPMALYWHFKDKDLLLEGISERLLSDVTLPTASARPWHDELRDVLSALLTVLRAHPAVAELVRTRVLLSDSGLEIAERTLGLLRSAGFDAEQAAQLASQALHTIVSLVTQEPGLMVGESPAEREERLRVKRASFAALSPERFPHMLASADAFTDCGNEPAYFELGVELFIQGVRGVRPG
ncbi:TetR/AcrR family transcriptional regulator C-terminal domain-containing protein [Cryptosporangium sp. NPDC048952]|uniref:TetR/AcrR family transcriptional regulator C-terminal domain-containing protein n=1 Tax=Cryptosporangium sp. NPDC048952 TaxID=3363961 RepID=UPI0037131A66